MNGKLDKLTREAIARAAAKAAVEVQEVYAEEWVTGDELCQSVAMITPQFLKLYGQTLPRECIRVTAADGSEHKTRWAYPKKRILRMIGEGRLRSVRA